MKTIGLIGGMSWESTALYYRLVNETTAARLGGLHSAKILLYSVDFDEVERLQRAGDWEACGRLLADAARRLERGGADFLVICTNTMHKVEARIREACGLPLLHIAEATADALLASGIVKVALLGTIYTMKQAFYKDRLIARGVEVLTPDEADMEMINGVIYDELCRGIVSSASRDRYRVVIEKLARRGARGVVLGCTEIGMLVRPEDAPLPVFDTTRIHATAAALLAMGVAPDGQPRA